VRRASGTAAMSDSRKTLRIAQLAPLWARVPPAGYGGTELRVYWLTQELVARGHQVTLFASGDSQTDANLHAVYPMNLMAAMASGAACHYRHYADAALAEALRGSSGFDLIHSHGEVEHAAFGILSAAPFVYSLRTALSADDLWLIQRYPQVNFVAMSAAQIRHVSDDRRAGIPVIYNGCRFGDYDAPRGSGGYLAFLGRMGRHKGPLAAIRIAAAARMPLVLAGKPQDSAEAAYFEREVKPRIDGRAVRHIGVVDQQQKRKFLSNAAALLFPIEWDEPFGNVMIEAMASGVPVLACRRGSVPEVVDQGVTGFHAEHADELADMVPAALRLNRNRVRDHAMRRFSHERMVDDYLRLYESLVGS
jgi:glycosyltransferase involved in cell wall biosynthesis